MSTSLSNKIERLGSARRRKIHRRAARLIAQENAGAGTGNVFSDLGLPSPEHEQLKARLTLQIYRLIKERELPLADVAQVLSLDRAQASILMRNRSGTFSVNRLQILLATLTGTIEDER